MSDYDNPWKDALDRWFEAFLAFFFPDAHRRIDWSRGWLSLDAELRQVVRDAELGKRLADKLVRVWLRDGREVCLLIHVEVQGWPEEDFARRMFVYHYRIFDRYNQQVISLAVLADDRRDWRPDHFGYDLAGCRLTFAFPIVKLLDFAAQRPLLEASDNPFAIVVLAHLATRQTHHDPASRHAWKVRLLRGLYERGLSRDDVLQLFNLIDWMMDLPPALEQLFKQEAEDIERENHMRYVTSIERLARQEGKAEGKAEGQAEMLLRALARRFQPTVPEEIVARIRAATDLALLDRWFDLVYDTGTLDEFQQRMQS
ncbi:MAG: transposase [Gemmataceae bacterium]